MTFRLSRIAFWVAAAAAAWALVAPRASVMPAIGLATVAALAAVALRWRAARRPETPRIGPDPSLRPLDHAALQDAPGALRRAVAEARSFDAALHAAARVLRSELGALRVGVHRVQDVDASHAHLTELIESAPGFRTVPRRVALDALPLGRSLRSGREVDAAPDAVVPVLVGGRVVAVVELGGIELPIEATAMAGLLALARDALSEAADGAAARTGADAAEVERHAPVTGRAGYPPGAVSGMLEALAPPANRTRRDELAFDDHPPAPSPRAQRPSLLTPAADATPATVAPFQHPATAAASADDARQLDAGAIARLRELDPTGQNQLVARVMTAFQTSTARLLPQARAARATGDRAALRLVVHTWKSSSASVGALQLSALCARIETRIRLEDTEPLDADLDALEVALDQTLRSIASMLEGRA